MSLLSYLCVYTEEQHSLDPCDFSQFVISKSSKDMFRPSGMRLLYIDPCHEY